MYWLNSIVTDDEFKEEYDAEMAKTTYKYLFLLKNYDLFTTLVGFAHNTAMSRVELEIQRSKTETKTKLWGDRDGTETSKNVSRDIQWAGKPKNHYFITKFGFTRSSTKSIGLSPIC